jgi:hypothetical protein
MGFLEDLKQEAQTVKAERQQQETTEQALQASIAQLQPRLKQIYAYLKDLVEQLNVVKPDLRVSYEVEGLGQLTGLKQGNYAVSADDPNNLNSVTLTFSCGHSDGDRRALQTADREAFLRQRDYLWEHNLQFDYKVSATGQATFLLQPQVTVKIECVPDCAAKKIRCTVRNLDRLGKDSYLIDPDAINAAGLDAIAAVVLRKSKTLETLTGAKLSEQERARIRDALQKEQEELRRHDRIVATITAAEERQATENRPINKLRRGVSDKVSRYVKRLRRTVDSSSTP